MFEKGERINIRKGEISVGCRTISTTHLWMNKITSNKISSGRSLTRVESFKKPFSTSKSCPSVSILRT